MPQTYDWTRILPRMFKKTEVSCFMAWLCQFEQDNSQRKKYRACDEAVEPVEDATVTRKYFAAVFDARSPFMQADKQIATN